MTRELFYFTEVPLIKREKIIEFKMTILQFPVQIMDGDMDGQ